MQAQQNHENLSFINHFHLRKIFIPVEVRLEYTPSSSLSHASLEMY